jgi:Arc/MetJ-type ribon-helix-helix transcriptional regulator
MMTHDDETENKERTPAEEGVEYRATIRFPRKDYEFMQKLINEGEYTNITEIVRDAVKRFRLEWSDRTAVQSFMPMNPTMGMRMMPRMRRMMEYMAEDERRRKQKE